ncbi:hypothetical protein GFV16_00075 [Bacillus megaterium]|uniref:hypothetical protein n=1 Tax=Priestia megaterium TaxID=1404 RepID=UPI001293F9A2|nr:hypothetical protein [Priestia megaterium]MQR84340.1 hypothetical protein [Priestia megaterium]
MMTLSEKERLQMLLRYLQNQKIVDQYQEPMFNPNNSLISMKNKQRQRDVSNRVRDELGRFLPYNYHIMEEYDSTLDREVQTQRKLQIKQIEGSYNSYAVNEKEKRDWSGNIYLACVATILAIAFFT